MCLPMLPPDPNPLAVGATERTPGRVPLTPLWLARRWTACLEPAATRPADPKPANVDHGAAITIGQQGMSVNCRQYEEELDELISTPRVHQMVFQGSRRLSTRRVGAVVTGPASAADTRLTAVQGVL
jgi:hypothetical protein